MTPDPLLRPSERPPAVVDVARVGLSHDRVYGWLVTSEYGVVKVHSTRDGCMFALNPTAARRVAEEFLAAVNEAADTTEIRSYGKVQSR